MDTDDSFGQLLNQALGVHDRSATWLAKRLGVNASTVAHWLADETRPTRKNMTGLLDVLGIRGAERDIWLRAAGYSITPSADEVSIAPGLPPADTPPPALPPKHYLRLIGRLSQLTHSLEVLQSPQHAPVVAIVGMGGIGKTALAREIVEVCHQKQLFDYIVWSSAKTEHLVAGEIVSLEFTPYTFETAITAIARQCGRIDITLLPFEERKRAVADLLRHHQILVVLDNFETAQGANALLYQLLEIRGKSKILVTSRHHLALEQVHTLPLQGLGEEEGLLFLKEESQIRNVESLRHAKPEVFQKLHRVTGGAPLAMRLVVGQMHSSPLKHVITTLAQANFREYDYPFYHFVYHYSWNLLDLSGRMLFVDLSVFPPLTGGTLSSVTNITQLPAHQMPGALHQLTSMSLVDKVGYASSERIALHPLTQYFIRSDITKEWTAHEP